MQTEPRAKQFSIQLPSALVDQIEAVGPDLEPPTDNRTRIIEYLVRLGLPVHHRRQAYRQHSEAL